MKLLFALLFLGPVIYAQNVKKEDKKLNIVFIMTDDHTTQALSAYDKRFISTPNLDRLANEGILFKNCFVTNAVCGPSRATILTGKFNHINGLTDNHKVFDSTQVIYPQILKKSGYQTAMIGKWHLGSTPMGFDYYSILPNQGEYYQPVFIENGKKVQNKGYVTDVVTDKAVEYLNGRDKEKPFLLIYQQKAPHRNWLPATRHLGMFDNTTFEEPSNLLDDYSNRGRAAKEQLMNISTDMWNAWDLKLASSKDLDSLAKLPKANLVDAKDDDFTNANNQSIDAQRFFQVFDRMTPQEKKAWTNVYDKRVEEYKRLNLKGDALIKWKYQQYMRDYLACVVAVDENVGRLLDYLEREGELDNTIIIYTSDQGFFLGEHGYFDKRMMYDECLRTPLLIRYPKGIKPGIVTDALAMNVDFAPTLLDYAGVKIPKDMQGKSLKPIIDNDGKVLAKWRDAVYYHYYEYPSWHMVKRHYGIRTDRYKLIHFYNDIDEWEMYDLEKDPKEMKNVYNDSSYAGVQKMMHAKMKKLQKQYKDTNPTEN